MINVIKRIFRQKSLAVVVILSIVSLLFDIFTLSNTSVSTYSEINITKASYIGIDMFAPLLIAIIFILISFRIYKMKGKKIIGLYLIALSYLVSCVITWLSHIYVLENRKFENISTLFSQGSSPIEMISFWIILNILLLLVGSIITGLKLRSLIDVKNDYLGLILLCTAFLIFINPWIAGFFIFSWIIFELRFLEEKKETEPQTAIS